MTLLFLPALTQSYLTILMRHVWSQHLCPKAGVNSLVPIRCTKYDGKQSSVRVQALP
jgi:hypothetical protein